jgi:glycogen debranching enzyme
LETAPHLRSAYELDESLMEFSSSLSKNILKNESDLDRIIDDYQTNFFEKLCLYQFYVLDVKAMSEKFTTLWKSQGKPFEKFPDANPFLDQIPAKIFETRVKFIASQIVVDDNKYNRFSKSVDFSKCILMMEAICYLSHIRDFGRQIDEFVNILDEINLQYYKEFDGDRAFIMTQIRNRAKFLRLEEHGPNLGLISRDSPFVDSYFARLPKNERTQNLHGDQMVLAVNGWVWNADPLVNFASATSKAYLRREVIPWGDCVKLRYGEKPVKRQIFTVG